MSDLFVGDERVEVVRKRIKNIYLRLDASDGHVVVSAPRWASNAEVQRCVAEHAGWIAKQRARLAAAPEQRLRQVESGEALFLWGAELELEVSAAKRFGMRLEPSAELAAWLPGPGAFGAARVASLSERVWAGECKPPDGAAGMAHLSAPAGSTADERRAYLRDWYRGQMRAAAQELVPAWGLRTGLQPAEWRLRWMKSRWGTCNTNTRRVWLNAQLAKHPLACMDYVVLHELCHLAHPNHSAVFWALVGQHMPDYDARRKRLNAIRLPWVE